MATNALRRTAERARSAGRRRAPVLELKRTAIKPALVGIVMGSTTDWSTMKAAAQMLDEFGVPYEAKVMSAHRTPVLVSSWTSSAATRGMRCIIAGAGGAAHLAGVVAAHTTLPVLGVPVPSKHLQGLDSLLSTVQMPKGIPVAAFAIGEAGAANAALYAVAILALSDARLASRLAEFRLRQAEAAARAELPKP